MTYGTAVMKIPILFLLSSMFLGTNCDVSYVPKITDDVLSCEDFKNEFLNCDELKLSSVKGDDGDDAATLGGIIETLKELSSEYDIEIDVWKVLDIAEEFVFNTRVNFCSSLEKPDAPWSPVVEKMNITSCPVPIKSFEVQGLTVSLESLKDVLSHEFCGFYRVVLSFMDGLDKISCHVIELRIVEHNDEDECDE